MSGELSASEITRTKIFKPAGPHNPLLGPAVCLCVECSKVVLAMRCSAKDSGGRQCGSHKGHTPKREHPLLVATVFLIAAERADR